MRVRLDLLAEWCAGSVAPVYAGIEATGVCVDTRKLRRGDLFVALRGPNFDGHDFVRKAVELGAAGVLVEKPESLANGIPGIAAKDSLRALGDMANRYRWHPPLIPWVGITGSNGKTTTRELTSLILRQRGPVRASAENFNNQIGVPLTIFSQPDDAWAGVVEMGTNAKGEIMRLVEIAVPTVGIVTSVGPGHLEGLGSPREVALEKASIFSWLPPDGVAIFPAADAFAKELRDHVPHKCLTFGIETDADLTAQDVRPTAEGVRFVVKGVEIRLPLLGRHNVGNCLAALLAAEHLGIGFAEAAEALRMACPVPGRLRSIVTDYLTVVDDSYNANPSSMQAALDVLRSMPGRRRIAVLGDMLELGEYSARMHREIGLAAGRSGIDALFTTGPRSVATAEAAQSTHASINVKHFGHVGGLSQALMRYLRPGDVVLVKASHGMRLDVLVDKLMNWMPGHATAIF